VKVISSKDNRLHKWLYLTFRIGTVCSLCFVSLGFILAIITKAEFTDRVVPPSQFFQRISELDPLAIITLGILILVLTPFSGVILATVTFLIAKDRLYLGVSVTVLCVLLLSLVLALV